MTTTQIAGPSLYECNLCYRKTRPFLCPECNTSKCWYHAKLCLNCYSKFCKTCSVRLDRRRWYCIICRTNICDCCFCKKQQKLYLMKQCKQCKRYYCRNHIYQESWLNPCLCSDCQPDNNGCIMQ